MVLIAALLVFADSSISPGVVIAIIIILALVVLSVSIWLFRTRLRYRNAVAQPHLVKKCSNCGTMMPAQVAYCPTCGREVPPVTTIV